MRFVFEVEIDRGATGTVYRAHDEVTGDTVAVKQLLAGIRVPQREVLLARKISHPNVCQVYDLYIEDGQNLISMEYVDGETLRSLMERLGAVPVGQALQITRQLLNGLEASHREGVIHRDLTPRNIMIARNGTVKIMDFGHARIVDLSPDLTGSRIAGTPGYVAPEQAMGLATDERADLFSVGVIFCEMVSGKRAGRVPPTNVPGVPAYVETAILCCLEMEPSRRFASASQLREALAGSRLLRPVPFLTASLATCLALVVGGLILSWRLGVTFAPIPSGPETAPVAVRNPPKHLPTVAVMFEGQIGDALARGLVRGGKYQVVERPTLDKSFSRLEKKDQKGIVGADYMLVGTFGIEDGRIRIDARLMETETTKVIDAQGISGDPADKLKLAEQLAALFQGHSRQ